MMQWIASMVTTLWQVYLQVCISWLSSPSIQMLLILNKWIYTMQANYMTYQQLDAKANQLAAFLVDNGVTREQPVGVMLERSLEMMVAMMAVLKAGGAYVPMDPEYPEDRLALMAEDSEVINHPNKAERWSFQHKELKMPPKALCCTLPSTYVRSNNTQCIIYQVFSSPLISWT